MSRIRTKDDYRLSAGASGFGAVILLASTAAVPFVEGPDLTTGKRVALAGVLALCGIGAAGLAMWSYRRISSAPQERPPVDEETKKQARTTALALLTFQGVLMLGLAAYGFSSGRPFVGYASLVAAVLYGGVAASLLRQRAGKAE